MLESPPFSSPSRKETLRMMSENGWPILPVIPGQKKPMGEWMNVTRDTYDFGKLFAYAPDNVNGGILTMDVTAVADFDNHGDSPNGMTLFHYMWRAHPEYFEHAIVERSQSDGRHIYYAGIIGSTYKVALACWWLNPEKEPISYLGVALDYNEEAIVSLEILCGRKFSFCYPSIGPKGRYLLLSYENFFNRKPEDLPGLPEAFHPLPIKMGDEGVHGDYNNYGDDRLSDPEEIEKAKEYYTNKNDYQGAGAHDQARPMARCLAGTCGMSTGEIEPYVKRYIRRHGAEGCGRDLTDKNEALRIAEYGKRNPFYGIPGVVYELRRQKEREEIKKIAESLRKIKGDERPMPDESLRVQEASINEFDQEEEPVEGGSPYW